MTAYKSKMELTLFNNWKLDQIICQTQKLGKSHIFIKNQIFKNSIKKHLCSCPMWHSLDPNKVFAIIRKTIPVYAKQQKFKTSVCLRGSYTQKKRFSIHWFFPLKHPNNQGWARASSGSPICMQGPKYLSHLSLLSQPHYQRAGSKVGQLGNEKALPLQVVA